jgi:formylglycine-generating enzyme required for sulfatase activity
VREGSEYAASCINWVEAIEFCAMLSKQEKAAGRLPAEWEFTLPSEAQWEYACRAGTTTAYSFANDAAKLGAYAWFHENADTFRESYAHQVATKLENPWGLYDMHGNVWEWCSDSFQSKLPGGADPEVTGQTGDRVVRGGGWGYSAAHCRSASRNCHFVGDRYDLLGFRLAAVPVRNRIRR